MDVGSTYFFEIEVTFELISSDDFNIRAETVEVSSSSSSSSTFSSSSEITTASTPSATTTTSLGLDSSTISSSQGTSSSTTGSASSTSSSPTPTNTTTESNVVAHSKLKPGAIGGIFVGVLALVLAIITLIWFLLRRRRRQRAEEHVTTDLHTPELEGGAATSASKQYELKSTPPHGGEIEKSELAGKGQEPFPAFSDDDPFPRSELSAPVQHQDPVNHNQSYEVAAGGSVPELDSSHHHNELDAGSAGVSLGELPAQSPTNAISSRKPVPSVQQQNTQLPERTEPRSDFAKNPPWTDDGGLNEFGNVGTTSQEGSVAGKVAAGASDDEMATLAAEQRRLSAEIADAERVRELKAQKAAVDQRLSLLKSKSSGAGP